MAIDPATGHEFAELPATSPAEVADLVEDARRALAVEHEWRTPSVRAAALRRAAEHIRRHAANLADFETRDTGTPLKQSKADVESAIRSFEDAAAALGRLEGRTVPLGPEALGYTLREPWGVCAQLLPWRRPLHTAARCAAPALAAGNAVILKPSELASVTPLRLAQLAEEAGVPRGMLQVATGDAATGEALARHPGTDHVTLVGSATAGAAVAAACAPRLVPVVLETGTRSPTLVFADADLDAAVPAIVAGVLRHTGSPLLVAADVFEPLIARLAEPLAKVKLGPGIEDPDLGPLISRTHLDRAAEQLEHARAGGARVLGGEPDERFLRPALVTRVTADMAIFREETPGPVLVAVPFQDERHALQLANANAPGRTAHVWTTDLGLAHRAAAGVRADRVLVNGAGADPGDDGLRTYSRDKRVRVTLGPPA